MAESAVSLVVDHLIPFLTQEARLLNSVPNEVGSIMDELDSIRVFLKDADARAETDEQVNIWVKQVRQVAFRMEDVLDEFRLRIAAQQSHSRGLLGWVCKTFISMKRLKPRRVIASEIQDIKANLIDINKRRERYHFKRSEEGHSSSENNGAWNYVREDALYVEESELVGIEKHRDELIWWLVKEGEKRQMVMAVVGEGGVGKTTLVKKAYESDRVRNNFQCRAWITVSQSFKIEELLVKLIKQFHASREEPFPQGVDAMERTQLIDNLRDYLRGKRYVVILDDAWSVELWNSLKNALLNNHCGSRIIVTTRTDDVASSFIEFDTFHLDPLSEEDALSLFYKKAFGSNFGGHCPPELEDYSKKIVKRSGRLPLAIVAMGGLLLTKEKTVFEWKKFHDNLSSELGEDHNLKAIMKIISLTYHDLPYYLKSCFLYFGVYPEDFEMDFFNLISLWITEGFVKEKPGKSVEHVAQDYLDQLINRSLVQADHMYFDGFCKVHDLMHEFIRSRMVKENYCDVLHKNSVAASYEGSRRLSVQSGGVPVVKRTISSPLVRSLFVFHLNEWPKSLMHTLLSSVRQLKTLDLAGTPLETFPHEITDLFHLKYLNLSDTFIKVLPDTLGRLQNLETLHLIRTSIVELPPAILKLQKLRHVRATQGSRGETSKAVKIPEGIGSLKALQLLSRVDVNQSDSIITDLGELTQLRYLSVMNFKKESSTMLCTSIAKMKFLSILVIISVEENKVLDLQFVSSPPPMPLQNLSLAGRLEMLPGWITLLSNLQVINLYNSRLMQDPIKVLQRVPSLQYIGLYHHAYDGEELHFPTGSFQKLKVLILSKLAGLHSVTIEKGALPVLKEMHIQACTRLEAVPEGIEHVINLRSLQFTGASDDFKKRLSEDAGEDYWKVKHIPQVLFYE